MKCCVCNCLLTFFIENNTLHGWTNDSFVNYQTETFKFYVGAFPQENAKSSKLSALNALSFFPIGSVQPHQTNLTPSKEITRNLTITIIQLATTQQSYVSQSSVTDLVTTEAEMNSVNDSPNLRYMILLCAGVTSLLVVLLCLTGFVLYGRSNHQ